MHHILWLCVLGYDAVFEFDNDIVSGLDGSGRKRLDIVGDFFGGSFFRSPVAGDAES